jgi:hypothetical protein
MRVNLEQLLVIVVKWNAECDLIDATSSLMPQY